jgi:hypothetical protein
MFFFSHLISLYLEADLDVARPFLQAVNIRSVGPVQDGGMQPQLGEVLVQEETRRALVSILGLGFHYFLSLEQKKTQIIE